MRLIKVLLLLLLFFIFVPTVLATSHYSYENSEKLKPLIHWREYGQDAFSQAQQEQKPVFLLLTAPSWCYWCQVYESQDYLFNSQIYSLINDKFIPIYVDADKRQDLTRQYLEGGWPSTTVLTPDGKRIYGYSGPRPVENMLTNLNQAVEYVKTNKGSNQISYNYQKTSPVVPTQEQLQALIDTYKTGILQSYDSLFGGFGTGQKFPQGRTEDFALDEYDLTKDSKWLELVQTTLKNQYTKPEDVTNNYHLFDPIEGGFHRYGTTRTWSPPHFEKMLYDNARLLKAYEHLLQITPDDPIAKEVVSKTLNYIQNNWYDNKNGGFYGNTDSAGEEYYKQIDRGKTKARVEKTKYTDWNSEAILTYIYLFKTTKNSEYKNIAEKTLNFYSQNIVTDKGALHYEKEDGSRQVRGNILDNAYLTLAFTQAYETFGDKKYLDSAQKLADYSLNSLYDWNSGGFFERNSPDTNLYIPQEIVLLTKPPEENGIMAYALLKLYKQTGKLSYLNAGIKTLGSNINTPGQLDSGYYFAQAAKYTVNNNLLKNYSKNKQQIADLEHAQQKSFWLTTFLANPPTQQAFTQSFAGITPLNGPFYILILIAFIAGFLSIISPCCLPMLPAYLAYSLRSEKQNLKRMTLAFFIGLSLVFTLLGMSATFIGNFLRLHLVIFSQVAGIVIMIFGILLLLGKSIPSLPIQRKKPVGYVGSFLFGMTFGISWTPCVGPILAAILLIASTLNSVVKGGVLLFIYSIGLALPLILLSFYLEKKKTSKFWQFLKGKEIRFVSGEKTFTIH